VDEGTRRILAETWTKAGHIPPSPAAPIPFRKVAHQSFLIELPKERDWIYAVKLSPQPGVRAVSTDGRPVRLLESYPYLLLVGSGPVELTFGTPTGARLGHWISAVALFLVLALKGRRLLVRLR
jgi:hypothetical protein